MDNNAVKRVKGRSDSQCLLQSMIIKQNIQNSRVLNSHFRAKAFRKTEIVRDKTELDKEEALQYVLSELELCLGFRIPKQTLQHAADYLKKKLEHKIICSVRELDEFSQKIKKVLSDVENFDCRQCKVDIAGQTFEFLVNDLDGGIEKWKIGQNFQVFEEERLGLSGDNIPNSIISACYEYEEALQAAFITYSEQQSSKSPQKSVKKSVFLINSEIEDSKKRKKEIFALQQDLEWQKEELKFTISHSKYQKSENLNRKILFDDQLEDLRRRRILMVQEQESIENQSKMLDSQRQQIRNIFLQLSKFIQMIENKKNQSVPDIASELNELEDQLRELEKKFKTCKKIEADSLQTQIYRIKTKISSLKSLKAINNSLTTSSSANNLMKNFSKVYSISNTEPMKPVSMKNSPVCFNLSIKIPKDPSSFNFSSLKTERSLSVGLSQLDSKDEESIVNTLLKQKEIRLIEKEEELNLIEEKIINKLGQVDQINDVKILKAETNRIKRRYESRQKELEAELRVVEKYKSELRDKGEELDNKFCEADEEMAKVEQEKIRLARVLEEIKEYLQGKIAEGINDSKN